MRLLPVPRVVRSQQGVDRLPGVLKPVGVTLLFVALTTACGGTSTTGAAPTSTTGSEPGSTTEANGAVSRDDFGSDWPLTVASGTLACAGSGGVGAATFTTSGKTYALNGIAKGQHAGVDIDPIWAANLGIPGAKKDIGVLINKALTLCK